MIHKEGVEKQRFNYEILIVTLGPLVALAIAILLICFKGWGRGINTSVIVLTCVMIFLTGQGITTGFHRLFTHVAFKTGKILRALFAIFGIMAFEGRVTDWVADHRRHHQHSDKEGDPHSPVFGRHTRWQRFLGFLHAHYGWMPLGGYVRDLTYVGDLKKDPVVQWVERYFGLWMILSLLIPTLIEAVIMRSLHGALLGFLWAGLVRIFVVHHVTWSINSICHVFGSRPFKSDDNSRNNPFIGILAMGEGYHNTHHAFQTSARHGLRFFEPDISWYVIWFLSKLRLVWDVRIPTEKDLESKRNYPENEAA